MEEYRITIPVKKRAIHYDTWYWGKTYPIFGGNPTLIPCVSLFECVRGLMPQEPAGQSLAPERGVTVSYTRPRSRPARQAACLKSSNKRYEENRPMQPTLGSGIFWSQPSGMARLKWL